MTAACPTPLDETDYDRRFGGLARLYGDDGLARLAAGHVAVIGIGGVGSWAAEALARSGVGQLTLIDLDHIAPSNTNRQIHALDGNYGKAKVDAMAERIRSIQPGCQLQLIDDFIDTDNLATHIDRRYDVVIDAIDQVRIKTLLIAHCRRLKLPLVVCGSAGGKLDPSRLRVADLSRVIQDPLLARIRGQLRKEHGFARERSMGVECIYSEEAVRRPAAASCSVDASPAPSGGLACTGYGSVVTVTATAGMIAASRALARLSGGK